MRSEHVSTIGSKHHDCVIGQTLFIQSVHQSAGIGVERGAECVVGREICDLVIRWDVGANLDRPGSAIGGTRRMLRSPGQKQAKRVLPFLFHKVDCQAGLRVGLELNTRGPILKSMASRSSRHGTGLFAAIQKPLTDEPRLVSCVFQVFGEGRLVKREADVVARHAAGIRIAAGDQSRA